MYKKSLSVMHLFFAVALGFTATQAACAQSTPVPATSTAPTTPVATIAASTIHGHIADPSGAVIPGAKITLADPSGTAITTVTADAAGNYVIPSVRPGTYIVEAFYDGFAPFTSPTMQIVAGQAKRVDISMAIEVAQQNVVVTDESMGLSTDASNNAGAVVLKGEDLEALSDDPDELASELQALAGPAAGPNGGQIYIDGFTGGSLPPKSAIREIRINQNPYSAEFDHPGFGRIEILTKPGTDKLHGQLMSMGNDSSFNTGNPFTPNVPEYHIYQLNGTVSGAISKTASFFFSAEQRNNQTPSLYTTTAVPVLGSNGFYAISTSQADTSGAIYRPQVHTEISPRIDVQLGQKNTLTLRYQYERSNQGYSLSDAQKHSWAVPAQSNNYSVEHSIQVSDSWVVNSHIVNETRFQYNRDTTNSTPAGMAPSISVTGAFSTGGGSISNNHQNHYELQNLTTMSLGAHALKFGARLRDNRNANFANSGYNGSFTFSDVNSYTNALNVEKGQACATGTTCTATRLSYTTGPLSSQSSLANIFDAALFIQDDWKFNRFLTLSGGLRWESQNHISDHSDWGPRVALAYALNGHHGKPTTTLIRAGFGLFYDRLSISNMLNAERYNGSPNGQQQYTLNNPTCFSSTSLGSINLSTCGSSTSTAANSTIWQIAPNYHSPYMEQAAASVEQQLNKGSKLAVTYIHTFGVHQLATRDSNAYKPGTFIYGDPNHTGIRPNTSLGIVDQYYPQAVFKSDQLIVNVNARLSNRLSIMGFYNYNSTHSNTGTASNSYNLNANYGRAGYSSTNNVFLMGTYQGPWGLNFNPFLATHSGRPYNITIATDLTGDNFFNSRPAYADTSNCSNPANASRYVQTSYGCLDSQPQPGANLIPANLGTGPAAVTFNLRVSKSIGIGHKIESAANSQNPAGGGPSMMGGPGGGRGGMGAMMGGMNGGRRGGQNNTGRRYALTLSAQALNLFNDINYAPPNGNITPFKDSNGTYKTNFGTYSSLEGRPFASGPSVRSIFLQAAFSF